MRVCDRCHEPAVDEIAFKSDDHRVDVCESCRQIALEALAKPQEKRRGRPPKNLGQPK